MDLRNAWQVTLIEQQSRQSSASHHGAFLQQVRARQRLRQAQSARLRLAAWAAFLAWLLAGIQSVIRP
ncbi:hypothetical protein [Noviherbaspirillum autotrophicum]|uniref:Uncharacterized protein n=1 Tax=Noviherbaspirillum autotrophicum TaxID=709839 RepID=A0A0C1YRE5_9BURK|nr:hypothetical protein [Noviherbaspirillum autotrophicum]KIF83232.1 hypothetical protein TSA66_24240 [Noviherbaspirillum autotrophicum]